MTDGARREQGEVFLGVSATRAIAKPLREWTNLIHKAVMFEVKIVAEGLPGSRLGLDQAAQRVSAAREKWETDTGPQQRRLVNLLAVRALTDHLTTCQAIGKWRGPSVRVLDEYLPRRTSQDSYFRVIGDRGEVVAGLTLDYDSLVWLVENDGHAAGAAARATPLASIAFTHLSRVAWKPGMGGIIHGADGQPVLSYP